MSWAVWITGLPGSGKSTIARAVVAELGRLGEVAIHLELDRVLTALAPTPTGSAAEREAVHRALVAIAAALSEAGIPVVIDATGHRREWRDLARAAIPHFAEISLRGSLAPPKQAVVPSGPLVPYEAALHPDVEVDAATQDVTAATARVVAHVRRHFAGRPRIAAGGRQWAIWISGPAGSGKTTIALGVAEALESRGIRVKVLEGSAVRQAIAGGGRGSEQHEEVAHRALIHAAHLLTDGGVAALIDATAARRAWRELARQRLEHFAEVQLVCPREVCLERERALRWHLAPDLHGDHRRSAEAEALEVARDYEQSLLAELTLQTHVEAMWTAVDDVVRLALRLHWTAERRVRPA